MLSFQSLPNQEYAGPDGGNGGNGGHVIFKGNGSLHITLMWLSQSSLLSERYLLCPSQQLSSGILTLEYAVQPRPVFPLCFAWCSCLHSHFMNVCLYFPDFIILLCSSTKGLWMCCTAVITPCCLPHLTLAHCFQGCFHIPIISLFSQPNCYHFPGISPGGKTGFWLTVIHQP